MNLATDFAGSVEAEVTYRRQCATNYFRLVQLTMIEGTNVVRKTILSRIRQRKSLHTILLERRSEFIQRGSGFTRQQLDVLYPGGENADLSRIDMTLWFALARKLHVMPKGRADSPPDNRTGWGRTTAPLMETQVEWCEDLATIHAVRNNLFHLVKPELDTEIFDDQFNRVVEALVRLDPGLDPEVDFERYKRAALNAGEAREFQLMIREQCLQERCQELTEDAHSKHRTVQMVMLSVSLLLLLILAGVLVFFLVFRQPRSCEKSLQYRVIGNLSGLSFMPRWGWGAEPASGHLDPQRLPVPFIAYTHTADVSQCSVTEECCNQVKNIQYLHMHQRRDKFFDIGFHYLIDNRGIIYEGREVTKVPSAVHGWNRNITSVAFIGNFMYQTPMKEAIGAFDILIAYLLINRWIQSNYTIYGMCELRPTDSPGINLYREINACTLGRIRNHVRTRKESQCWFNETTLRLNEDEEEHFLANYEL